MKNSWRAFTAEPPGCRFVQYHCRAQRSRSVAKRVLRIVVGVVLTAAGVVLLFIPGPGTLLLLFGMAMFSSESRLLARFLDRTEVFGRAQLKRLRRWWRPHPLA